MTLHGEHEGQGPRLVLLHGFTQTGRCWGPVAPALRDAGHELVRLDAPGHGGSSAVRADLEETAALILDAAGGPALYLGYSMGARMALHVALAAPTSVRGLILVGGTPGIEDAAERAARRDHDRALAARIRRDGVEAFLAGWLDQPLFASLPGWARFEEERARNDPDGLASSLELAGTGTQRPLWSELGRLDVPVLAVAGADDARYAAIASRMAGLVGAAGRAALVPGAGHAAHLEQPDAFLEIVLPWLADLTRNPRR